MYLSYGAFQQMLVEYKAFRSRTELVESSLAEQPLKGSGDDVM